MELMLRLLSLKHRGLLDYPKTNNWLRRRVTVHIALIVILCCGGCRCDVLLPFILSRWCIEVALLLNWVYILLNFPDANLAVEKIRVRPCNKLTSCTIFILVTATTNAWGSFVWGGIWRWWNAQTSCRAEESLKIWIWWFIELEVFVSFLWNADIINYQFAWVDSSHR